MAGKGPVMVMRGAWGWTAAALLSAMAALAWVDVASADPLAEILSRGWAEEDLARVPAILREDVEETMRDPGLVRHFGHVRVRSDLVTENWLMDHPPIAAAVGRELGALPFVITESWPDTYAIAGNPIKEGSLHVLLRTERRAVVYSRGRVYTPVLGDIGFHAAVCVRWWRPPRTHYVQHDIFVYARLRSRTARVIAFLTRPISGPWITRRLRWLIDGGVEVAEAVSADPKGMAARMAEYPDRGTVDHLAWDDLIRARATP